MIDLKGSLFRWGVCFLRFCLCNTKYCNYVLMNILSRENNVHPCGSEIPIKNVCASCGYSGLFMPLWYTFLLSLLIVFEWLWQRSLTINDWWANCMSPAFVPMITRTLSKLKLTPPSPLTFLCQPSSLSYWSANVSFTWGSENVINFLSLE